MEQDIFDEYDDEFEDSFDEYQDEFEDVYHEMYQDVCQDEYQAGYEKKYQETHRKKGVPHDDPFDFSELLDKMDNEFRNEYNATKNMKNKKMDGSFKSCKSKHNFTNNYDIENKKDKEHVGNNQKDKKKIVLGQDVYWQGKFKAVVRFIGVTEYAAGEFVGLEMDDTSIGKNNGCIRGVRYFDCKDKSGLMVRKEELYAM